MVPNGEILILAGDIVPFRAMEKHLSFFDYVSDHFQATYWLPGNHEYYYSDIADRSGTFNESIRSNVFLLNNVSLLLDKVKLLFSTLWTPIKPEHHYAIMQAMSDFQVISNGDRRLIPQDYTDMHDQALAFLSQELAKPSSCPVMVVSHHVPTLLNYPPEYLGGVLNEAFAVELDKLIDEHSPDYWLYGHHHRNVAAFKMGNTTLLTNQLGYVRNGEHTEFEDNKIISM